MSVPTATIALSPATVNAGTSPKSGDISVATVTVTNNDTVTSLEVVGIRPIVYKGGTTKDLGPANAGTVAITTANQVIAAAGTQTYTFGVNPFKSIVAKVAGQQVEATQLTYDVTCQISCSDGTDIVPTVATLTVNPTSIVANRGAGADSAANLTDYEPNA